MEPDLLRRAEDLCRRCERQAIVTSTGFLTPAEQAQLKAWAARQPDTHLFLFGGAADCERKAAFFLPFYVNEEEFAADEYLCALRCRSSYGTPGHRDYLGAILGLGVGREWLGDIRIDGETAYLFCLPSVARILLDQLEQVGRSHVQVAALPLSEVPVQERRVRSVSFTVQSLRLDAVAAGMFGLSRTQAAAQIAAGSVSLNYLPCLKPDAPVSPEDVISVRGKGKGSVSALGGTSRKGRTFVQAEVWL